MNKFLRGRTRVVTWTAAGLAGAGALVGVANAATSNGSPSNSTANGSLTALSLDAPASPAASAGPRKGNGKLAQIEQKLAAGAVHGEVVLDTKKGMETVEFQRGTVSNATGGSAGTFTVTDASGTADTWTLSSTTKVRERKARQPDGSAQISDGEDVVVIGLKTDGDLTARAVVVMPAKAAT